MSVSAGVGMLADAIVWAEKKNDFDLNSVTPGVEGFIAIAVVAIVVVLIGLDLNRRVRRVNYRGQIRERLEAEAAEGDSSAAGDGDDKP